MRYRVKTANGYLWLNWFMEIADDGSELEAMLMSLEEAQADAARWNGRIEEA